MKEKHLIVNKYKGGLQVKIKGKFYNFDLILQNITNSFCISASMKSSLFILFIMAMSSLQISNTQSPALQQCHVCQQCLACSQDIRSDQLVDQLHEIIEQKFSLSPNDKPQAINRSQPQTSIFQYSFLYASGFSAVLKVDLATGQVSIQSYQNKVPQSTSNQCSTCNNAGASTDRLNSSSGTHSASPVTGNLGTTGNTNNLIQNGETSSIGSSSSTTNTPSITSPSNSISTDPKSSQNQTSDNVQESVGQSQTDQPAKSVESSTFNQGIRSATVFFTSIREFPMTTNSSLQLLSNFIFRRFYSTNIFQALTTFPASTTPVNVNRIKAIYFKAYSVRYFRIIYVFLNERPNGKINQNPTLEFYELIVSQEPSGLNLVSGTRISQQEITWITANVTSSTSGVSNGSNLVVFLNLRNQRILDSSRFDINSLNISFFTQKNQNPQSPNGPIKTIFTTNEAITAKTSFVQSDSSSYEYQQVPNISTNPEVLSLNKFLSEYFYLTYKRLELRKVEREFILKKKEGSLRDEIVSYRLTYRIRKIQSGSGINDEPLHYEIIVTKYIKASGAVSFQIVNANYINLLPLYEVRQSLEATFLSPSQVNEDQNLPFIDSIVLREFKEQLGPQPPILKIKRHEPYYELTYKDLNNREIKITLLYEIVMNTIEFYVEGKKTNKPNDNYQYLTDSAKRASGTVVTNQPRTSGTATFTTERNSTLAQNQKSVLSGSSVASSGESFVSSVSAASGSSVGSNQIESGSEQNFQTQITSTPSINPSSLNQKAIITDINSEATESQPLPASTTLSTSPHQVSSASTTQQLNSSNLPESSVSTQIFNSSNQMNSSPSVPISNSITTGNSLSATTVFTASQTNSPSSATIQMNPIKSANIITGQQSLDNTQTNQSNKTTKISQFWASRSLPLNSSFIQDIQVTNFIIVSIPKPLNINELNQASFSELQNYFSSHQVNRLVKFLFNTYGQTINNFMKLNKVEFSQFPTSNSNDLRRTLFKMHFEIRRYESLSDEAKSFTEGSLMYEITLEYNWSISNPSNANIRVLRSEYLNNYCYLGQSGSLSLMLNKVTEMMMFDRINLLSDQYYVTINQQLMNYEVRNYLDRSTNVTSNIPFRNLVRRAHIRRVGRLLPYYWMEYNNGVVAILWYQVLNRQITLIALVDPNSDTPSSLNFATSTSARPNAQQSTNLNQQTSTVSASSSNPSISTSTTINTSINPSSSSNRSSSMNKAASQSNSVNSSFTAQPSSSSATVLSSSTSSSGSDITSSGVAANSSPESVVTSSSTGPQTSNIGTDFSFNAGTISESGSQKNIPSNSGTSLPSNFGKDLNGIIEPFGPIHIIDQTTQLNKQQIEKNEQQINQLHSQLRDNYYIPEQPTQTEKSITTSLKTNSLTQTNSHPIHLNQPLQKNIIINQKQLIFSNSNDSNESQNTQSQNTQSQNTQSQNTQSQNIQSQNIQSQNTQSQNTQSQNIQSQNTQSQSSSSRLSLASRTTSQTQSNPEGQNIEINQTRLMNVSLRLSQEERNTARQTMQSIQRQTIRRQIESIDGTKFMSFKLMQYEQLPAGMLNDFMSPYYLVFREQFLKNIYSPNGRIPLNTNLSSSTISQSDNKKSLQFDLNRFTTVFINQFLKFTMIPIQQLPNFQIVVSQTIYDSGFRVLVSCPAFRKVYEIILTKLHYLVLSFKEIQSLREITLGVNQIQFIIEKSIDKEGKSIDTIRQYLLVKNYAQLIRLFFKDMQIEQIKEVSLSFVPEGFLYHLSYIARRMVISSVTGRQSVQKEWYGTQLIYEVDSDNLVLSRHRLYKQGMEITNKRSILFPKQDLWQQPWIGRSNVSITDSKILMGIGLANRQADSIFAGSEWRIEEKEWQVQVYQVEGQSNQECFISMSMHILDEMSIQLVLLYNFKLQRLISVEWLEFGSGWYVPIRAYNKRDQSSSSLSQIHRQILSRSREISVQMFRNQLMAGQTIPEQISLRRVFSPNQKQIHYYKLYFNTPILYELIIKATITSSQQIESLQLIGARRNTHQVQTADQFYDHNNPEFQGFASLDPLSVKYDQTYNFLFNQALIKYPSVRTSNLLAIFTKQTPEQIIYKLILDISSVVNILDMTNSKFDVNNNDLKMHTDTTFPVNGFYQRNCLKQSSKGYCVICNNQFAAASPLLSNGRCFNAISRCQSQLAFACMYCMAGFQLYNNQCIQSNIVTSQLNRRISSLTSRNSVLALTQENDKICKTFDVRGNCVQCPDEQIYVLYESICYLRNQMVISSESINTNASQMINVVRTDEFCKRWISAICIDCIQGSIMGATRKCQASRDNCINYNTLERKCQTCSRDFKNASGRCIR